MTARKRLHWRRNWVELMGVPLTDLMGVEPRFVGADGVVFLVLPNYSTAEARDIERDEVILSLINKHRDHGEPEIHRIRVLPPRPVGRSWARCGIVRKWRDRRSGGSAA